MRRIEKFFSFVGVGVTDNWKQRIEAVGNGQVPACAALAWRTLMQRALSNGPQFTDYREGRR
jgi:hypothetical protein